jgi:AcrR family transcriptional regulator
MSIQDILRELGMSNGAFFHYFDSKAAVLEALIKRWMTQNSGFLILCIILN